MTLSKACLLSGAIGQQRYTHNNKNWQTNVMSNWHVVYSILEVRGSCPLAARSRNQIVQKKNILILQSFYCSLLVWDSTIILVLPEIASWLNISMKPSSSDLSLKIIGIRDACSIVTLFGHFFMGPLRIIFDILEAPAFQKYGTWFCLGLPWSTRLPQTGWNTSVYPDLNAQNL